MPAWAITIGAEAPTGVPVRIVIADYTYADLLTRLLAGPERDVIAVSSAEDAMREARARRVDLLLTRALFESGRNGFELAREIIAEAGPKTGIVIFSPYEENFLVEKLGPPPAGAVLLPRWTVPRLLDTLRDKLAHA